MRNSNIIAILIAAVIITIALIGYFKNNDDVDEETIKCIASKTRLFVSKTCSHCAQQEDILGNYAEYFNVTDCADEREKCEEAGIIAVPAWLINDNKYLGVKTFKELKSLTNC